MMARAKAKAPLVEGEPQAALDQRDELKEKEGGPTPTPVVAAEESSKRRARGRRDEQQQMHSKLEGAAPQSKASETFDLTNQAALHAALDSHVASWFLDQVGLIEDVRLSNLRIVASLVCVVTSAATYFLATRHALLAAFGVALVIVLQLLLQWVYMRKERGILLLSRPLAQVVERAENLSFSDPEDDPEAEGAEARLAKLRLILPKRDAAVSQLAPAGGKRRGRSSPSAGPAVAPAVEAASALASASALGSYVVVVRSDFPRYEEYYSVTLALRPDASLWNGLLGPGPKEFPPAAATSLSVQIYIGQTFDRNGALVTDALDAELNALWERLAEAVSAASSHWD